MFTSTTQPTSKRPVGRPPKYLLDYSVSFESDSQPCLTLRGQIRAGNPSRATWLAVRDAQSRAKGIRWRSLSVCIEKVRADQTMLPAGGPATQETP